MQPNNEWDKQKTHEKRKWEKKISTPDYSINVMFILKARSEFFNLLNFFSGFSRTRGMVWNRHCVLKCSCFPSCSHFQFVRRFGVKVKIVFVHSFALMFFFASIPPFPSSHVHIYSRKEKMKMLIFFFWG